MWIKNHYMPATEDMKVDAIHLLLQTAQHIANTTENKAYPKKTKDLRSNKLVSQLNKLNDELNFHQLSVPDPDLEKHSKFKQSEAISNLVLSVMVNIKKAYSEVSIFHQDTTQPIRSNL